MLFLFRIFCCAATGNSENMMIQGLTKIPESVTDRQALFAGDILATGFWAARITEIGPEDTVLILGAGPTGICTLLCVLLKAPKQVIVCEKDPARLRFVREHYPQVLTVGPEAFANGFLGSEHLIHPPVCLVALFSGCIGGI